MSWLETIKELDITKLLIVIILVVVLAIIKVVYNLLSKDKCVTDKMVEMNDKMFDLFLKMPQKIGKIHLLIEQLRNANAEQHEQILNQIQNTLQLVESDMEIIKEELNSNMKLMNVELEEQKKFLEFTTDKILFEIKDMKKILSEGRDIKNE